MACCRSWGHKELDTTEQLNNNIPEMGFPGGSVVKNPPANARDVGAVLALRGSHGEWNGSPL